METKATLKLVRTRIKCVLICSEIENATLSSLPWIPPHWPSGKASASRAEDPVFESRLRRDFFGVKSYQ